MIIEGTDGRLAINMTRAETLELIAKLAKGVAHADKVGSCWMADGVIYEANGKQFPGRLTIRVEG